MLVAPDSRLGLLYVAFVIQALHQVYELSQIVSKCPFLSQIIPKMRV